MVWIENEGENKTRVCSRSQGSNTEPFFEYKKIALFETAPGTQEFVHLPFLFAMERVTIQTLSMGSLGCRTCPS